MQCALNRGGTELNNTSYMHSTPFLTVMSQMPSMTKPSMTKQCILTC